MNQVVLSKFSEQKLDELIAQGFRFFGLDQKLPTIRSVFLKPNLVSDNPEYIAQGANTDVRIIRAVIKYLASFPNLQIRLGESESGSKLKGRRLAQALSVMGVTNLQRQYPFEIVNLTNDQQVEVTIPGGRLIKKIQLGRSLVETDLIINLPKIKTHKYATITCALKNMFGVIPDPRRVVWHKNIHQALSDINRLFYRKMFVITDGIIGMEGNGPLYGRKVDLGLLLFADDPIYNDIVATKLMGLPTEKVKHIQLCLQWAGVDPTNYSIVDKNISSFRRSFRPAKPNIFVWLEGRLVQHRWVVNILYNEWFQRNITYHLRHLLKWLRGGSYSWYIDQRKDRK